jgi:LDH2 family malate/lactate/ureidoglycolate dehydrogenase
MRILADSLKTCAVEILMACGEDDQNALRTAGSMIRSDARGIVTHGTYLLTPIFERVRMGQLSLPTQVKVVSDTGATAVLDGNGGLGAAAGQQAVDIAGEKAEQYGVGMVLIRNTNNVGSLAYYTEQLANRGMIALMSCNAASAMSPWGGAEAFLGTNPIAIAIYSDKAPPFSADMATSVVARGKIRKASRNGENIPDGWALDVDGNVTTNPDAALKGTLLPMGGPKGSALALAADILSGMLSGSTYAPNLKSFHQPEGQTGVGASLIAAHIPHFMDLVEFGRKMSEYRRSIKALKKANAVEEIMMPGELESRKETDSYKNGIYLDDNAVAAIQRLLKEIHSGTQLRTASTVC